MWPIISNKKNVKKKCDFSWLTLKKTLVFVKGTHLPRFLLLPPSYPAFSPTVGPQRNWDWPTECDTQSQSHQRPVATTRFETRWAPTTSYTRSYWWGLYKWPYRWGTGGCSPTYIGVRLVWAHLVMFGGKFAMALFIVHLINPKQE